MRAELVAGRLPPNSPRCCRRRSTAPTATGPEIKALKAACVDSGLSAARLLLACGALASSYDFHYDRASLRAFPGGHRLPALDVPVLPTALPRAEVAAFSIKASASTTEMDDAFSVTPRAEGGWRIGIHIAAPALGFARGSTLDAVARRRLSTVCVPAT